MEVDGSDPFYGNAMISIRLSSVTFRDIYIETELKNYILIFKMKI